MAGALLEEVLLAFPAPSRERVSVARQFRSTWLTSSIRAIKERGRYDEYMKRLPREHHDAVQNHIAGVWLPTEVAVAHYKACDALGFTPQEEFEIGRKVNEYAQATIFGMFVKMAKGAGATPWLALGKFNFLWERTWIGGGVAVYKTGPKEARIEVAGWPCADTRYIRNAMRGVIHGMLSLFCQKIYVSEIGRLCTEKTLGYRVAWA